MYAFLAAISDMQSLPIDFLQFGAFGLLVFIVVWHGKMTSKVVDRALTTFDNMSKTMKTIEHTLVSFEGRLTGVEEKLEECNKIRAEKRENG